MAETAPVSSSDEETRVEEPSSKRVKTEGAEPEEEQGWSSWGEGFETQLLYALAEHGRDELINGLFDTWDHDGTGRLTFDEILPYYMKSGHHHNELEPEVRAGFHHFMASQGKAASDGLTPDLFRKWLGKLTDEQVAAHYVRHVKGWAEKPYLMNVRMAIVKDYQHKSLKEILDSPVHALRGLSEHAEGVLAPLGLHTVRDVGNWRCFLTARAICALAPKEVTFEAYPEEQETGRSHAHINIRNALMKEHEATPLKHVQDLPVSALSIFPPAGNAALESIRIKNIRHLGNRKYFHWANAMVQLEQFEA